MPKRTKCKKCGNEFSTTVYSKSELCGWCKRKRKKLKSKHKSISDDVNSRFR